MYHQSVLNQHKYPVFDGKLQYVMGASPYNLGQKIEMLCLKRKYILCIFKNYIQLAVIQNSSVRVKNKIVIYYYNTL